MQAAVFDKNGGPGRFTVREVGKPSPKDDEVLVKINSVSINAADYRSMRMGLVPKRGIFGADIAGTVEAAGAGVRKFKTGDRVFGDISNCGFGGFAQYAAVPERFLASVPESVSFEIASAVPMAAATALQGLRDKGGIRRGMKVLVHGAGGGVGTFAVQLAKHFETDVTAVCGPENADLLRSLGADRVVDYTKEDFTRDDIRYDLILAVNGNRPLSAYRRSLAPDGVCVTVGGALSQVFRTMLFGPFMSAGGRKFRILAAKPDSRDLEFLIDLVALGEIKPVVDRRYPLGETAEAVRYAERGHSKGKTIISVI